jgi:hypothetical protein
MCKKRNKKNPTQNNKSQKNHFFNILFLPFSLSSKGISIVGLISTLICVVLFYFVIIDAVSFTSDQLNQISNFTVNINLVVGAIGLALFLPKKNEQTRNELIFSSYVGTILLSTACAIFGYIVSYVPFLPVKIISIYCVAMFLFLSLGVLETAKTIIAISKNKQ